MVSWEGMRFVIRSASVDRENLEWMERSLFWEHFQNSPVAPGEVVFDLGAHIGSFGLRAAADRGCSVFGVEPDEDSAMLYKVNALLNKLDTTQTIFRGAVGEFDSQCLLYQATTNWAHTTTGVGGPHNVLTGTTTLVDCIALRSCFVMSRSDKCAFMKVNVEGAEFGFFQGSSIEDLKRVGAIAAELHFDMAPGKTEDELVDKLTRAGFRTTLRPDSVDRAFLLATR